MFISVKKVDVYVINIYLEIDFWVIKFNIRCKIEIKIFCQLKVYGLFQSGLKNF